MIAVSDILSLFQLKQTVLNEDLNEAVNKEMKTIIKMFISLDHSTQNSNKICACFLQNTVGRQRDPGEMGELC